MAGLTLTAPLAVVMMGMLDGGSDTDQCFPSSTVMWTFQLAMSRVSTADYCKGRAKMLTAKVIDKLNCDFRSGKEALGDIVLAIRIPYFAEGNIEIVPEMRAVANLFVILRPSAFAMSLELHAPHRNVHERLVLTEVLRIPPLSVCVRIVVWVGFVSAATTTRFDLSRTCFKFLHVSDHVKLVQMMSRPAEDIQDELVEVGEGEGER